MAFIYKITNLINGKCYIGKTQKTIKYRWRRHLDEYKMKIHTHRPLYHAMDKYGIENFSIEQIEECTSDLACEREKFWIKEYNSYGDNGYNATIGGDGAPYIDRENILNLYQEYKNMAKISEITGHDPTTIGNILREFKVDYIDRHNFPKITFSKKTYMYDLKNNFIKEFNSLTDACNWIQQERNQSLKKPTNLAANISAVCKGKRKTAYGYIWKYSKEEDNR